MSSNHPQNAALWKLSPEHVRDGNTRLYRAFHQAGYRKQFPLVRFQFPSTVIDYRISIRVPRVRVFLLIVLTRLVSWIYYLTPGLISHLLCKEHKKHLGGDCPRSWSFGHSFFWIRIRGHRLCLFQNLVSISPSEAGYYRTSS